MVKALEKPTEAEARERWLQAVATRVTRKRPDIGDTLVRALGVEPQGEDVLHGLSIGEIGVCYEALLSTLDRESRRSQGQYFTPDDASDFMAAQSVHFPPGTWLDPCCGVGNLAWHLAKHQLDAGEFVKDRLVLIDKDVTALRTAVALISAEYAGADDALAVERLQARAQCRDFLSDEPVPAHDYVMANPPYARAPKREGFRTASTHDLFAYFLERIAQESEGFIVVTPASYLAAAKFQPLRSVLEDTHQGGNILVFDNVPDTLFRGYKYGSANTSKTNFVRAAITWCAPATTTWRISPIIRWPVSHREDMFQHAAAFLAPRRTGPSGEWAKVLPGLSSTWDFLMDQHTTIGDLVVSSPSKFSLDVPLTPRYYISATYRTLERGSKAVLYFANEDTRNRAALVLNSSIPYIWWRALDGGVTLPRRVLLSTPVPEIAGPGDFLVTALKESEEDNLVTKLNAGRINENVKHPERLVRALDEHLVPTLSDHDRHLLYTNNMFDGGADPTGMKRT